jgi:hypothetical protein
MRLSKCLTKEFFKVNISQNNIMTRFGHDPIKMLGHDRMRVMTQQIISVMTEMGHDPSLGQ